MLDLEEIHELLARRGMDARRSLGQNFVADPTVVMEIARWARVGPGDQVVEIGPGLGSLTLALADTGASVLAIEKDRTLLPVLDEVLRSRQVEEQVQVLEADALERHWIDQLAHVGGRWVLVANLPYNVSVPVIMTVLEAAPMVDRLVVMVQKEVADRLVAGPGGRTVGIPSIRLAWYASGHTLGLVPPDAFVPQPRVMSAVVEITRRSPPTTLIGPDAVLALVEAAYRQRRKMLRSTLGRTVPAEAFDAAGIKVTQRPEELGVEDWTRLAVALAEQRPG